MGEPDGELHALRERAKELRTLYRVVEVLADRERPPEEAFRLVLDAIPAGWQDPDRTEARIEYLGRSTTTPGFRPSRCGLRVPLRIWLREVGAIEVVSVRAPDGTAGDP